MRRHRLSAPRGWSSVGLQPEAVACMRLMSVKTDESPCQSCAAWLSPIAKRLFDEFPRERGHEEGCGQNHEFRCLWPNPLSENSRNSLNDDQGPVPEVERIGDHSDKDDGRQGEQPADNRRPRAACSDDQRGAETRDEGSGAGEGRSSVVNNGGKEDGTQTRHGRYV